MKIINRIALLFLLFWTPTKMYSQTNCDFVEISKDPITDIEKKYVEINDIQGDNKTLKTLIIKGDKSKVKIEFVINASVKSRFTNKVPIYFVFTDGTYEVSTSIEKLTFDGKIIFKMGRALGNNLLLEYFKTHTLKTIRIKTNLNDDEFNVPESIAKEIQDAIKCIDS